MNEARQESSISSRKCNEDTTWLANLEKWEMLDIFRTCWHFGRSSSSMSITVMRPLWKMEERGRGYDELPTFIILGMLVTSGPAVRGHLCFGVHIPLTSWYTWSATKGREDQDILASFRTRARNPNIFKHWPSRWGTWTKLKLHSTLFQLPSPSNFVTINYPQVTVLYTRVLETCAWASPTLEPCFSSFLIISSC